MQCENEVVDMARCDEGQVRAIQTRRRPVKLPQIQYIDKIVGVAVTMQRQVPTAPVRGTTDAAVKLPQVSTLKGSSLLEL